MSLFNKYSLVTNAPMLHLISTIHPFDIQTSYDITNKSKHGNEN